MCYSWIAPDAANWIGKVWFSGFATRGCVGGKSGGEVNDMFQ